MARFAGATNVVVRLNQLANLTVVPEASKAPLPTKRRTFVEAADFSRRTLQNPVVDMTFRVSEITKSVEGSAKLYSKRLLGFLGLLANWENLVQLAVTD